MPAPAAGADWLFTLPGGSWWALLVARALLTTSAVVANRAIHYRLTDGSVEIARGPASPAIVAGSAVPVTLAYTHATPASAGDATGLSLGVPQFWLPAGYQLGVITNLLDAGDTWTNIELTLLELDQGPLGELAYQATPIGY